LKEEDWYLRLFENLPFPIDHISIIGMSSKTEYKQFKTEKGYSIPQNVHEKDLVDSRDNIYVYAGFLKPGKHQIIIYDKKVEKYFARDIIIDFRNHDIQPSKNAHPKTQSEYCLFSAPLEPCVRQHESDHATANEGPRDYRLGRLSVHELPQDYQEHCRSML
jgi:hypothetical protein